MRFKGLFCLILGLLLCLGAMGCSGTAQDHYALLRGGFEAEVEGELNGVHFCALFEAAMTPEAGVLAGTILARDTEGVVTLTTRDVVLRDPVGEGFSALLELFPTGGEDLSVTLDEGGRTQVTAREHTLTFLPDGTPYAVKTDDLAVRVVRFERTDP